MGSTDIERLREAEKLLKDGEYSKSANIYVSSSIPFEEVLLKFIQVNDPTAVKELLVAKLEGLPSDNQTQITLIIVCLLEVILQIKSQTGEGSDEADLLDVEMRTLIEEPKVKECLLPWKNKIYDLIVSHGTDDDILFIAREMGDFDTVIDFLVKRHRTKEAVEFLKESPSSELKYLIEKYGHCLMKDHPKEVVSILKKCDSEPFSILPCLLRGFDKKGDPRRMKYIIEYVEDFVGRRKKKDPGLINLLLTLYADFDDRKLMRALNSSSSSSFPFNFESVFILDSCKKKGMTEACVKILEKMGLFEDAVKHALIANKIPLAQEVAKNPALDDRLHKKLWLMIARTVVSGETNVKEWLQFAQESADVSVTDLLPLMPEVETIDPVKNALSSCLQEYTERLNGLKEDMAEAAGNVEETKDDIKSWRRECSFIHSWTQCCICDEPVSSGPFASFACDHVFHLSCLSNQDECTLCGRPVLLSIDRPLPASDYDSDWS